MSDLRPEALIRDVRLVPVGGVPARTGRVDLRISGGRIVDVGPGLEARRSEVVHHGQGAWALPGLWDHHVHLRIWASTFIRADLAGSAGPAEVTARVRAHVEALPGADRASTIIGFGHRSATWDRPATVAELDEVSGEHPVILISGDGHHGWLNTAALRLLDAPATTGTLSESAWFPVFARVDSLPGVAEASDAAYARAVVAAAARGVVGVGDMEFGPAQREWPARFAEGVNQLRVRAAVYPEGLDDVIAAGLHSGDELGDTAGLVRMGPLKIIGDGSLNTLTAHCLEPYVDSPHGARGAPNLEPEELESLGARATAHGLDLAVHAIGDAAVRQTLDSFAATGARGSIEHAQLVSRDDLGRMAQLGVVASVQPAHLLDDRDVTMRCWPDRADRCFALRSMREHGVVLRMGSDAPVSPLDPWLTMAAAVHRSGDDREPWHPEQALSPEEALAASTDGQTTLAPGGRGDVVLVDGDPLAMAGVDLTDAAATRSAATGFGSTRVLATFVAGRPTYLG